MQYSPSTNHPWRRYKTKEVTEKAVSHILPLKKFLTSLALNWDTYTIPDDSFSYPKIAQMNDAAIAAWLGKMLKRWEGNSFQEDV